MISVNIVTYIFSHQLQYKETEGSSFRDSPSETPGTPKVSFVVLSLSNGRSVFLFMY